MRQLVSPFLGREASQNIRKLAAPAQNLAAERYRATLTLEKLRHRAYMRADSLGRFMQRLGDWGRKYFPPIRFRY